MLVGADLVHGVLMTVMTVVGGIARQHNNYRSVPEDVTRATDPGEVNAEPVGGSVRIE